MKCKLISDKDNSKDNNRVVDNDTVIINDSNNIFKDKEYKSLKNIDEKIMTIDEILDNIEDK